jgi:hypothetical protein
MFDRFRLVACLRDVQSEVNNSGMLQKDVQSEVNSEPFFLAALFVFWLPQNSSSKFKIILQGNM